MLITDTSGGVGKSARKSRASAMHRGTLVAVPVGVPPEVSPCCWKREGWPGRGFLETPPVGRGWGHCWGSGSWAGSSSLRRGTLPSPAFSAAPHDRIFTCLLGIPLRRVPPDCKRNRCVRMIQPFSLPSGFTAAPLGMVCGPWELCLTSAPLFVLGPCLRPHLLPQFLPEQVWCIRSPTWLRPPPVQPGPPLSSVCRRTTQSTLSSVLLTPPQVPVSAGASRSCLVSSRAYRYKHARHHSTCGWAWITSVLWKAAAVDSIVCCKQLVLVSWSHYRNMVMPLLVWRLRIHISR